MSQLLTSRPSNPCSAMIPFLEYDMPTGLMGANMQRQAVPLLKPEVLRVATGMENQPVSTRARSASNSGKVTFVDAERIVVDNRTTNC